MKAKRKKISLNNKTLKRMDGGDLASVSGGLQGSPDWNEKTNKKADAPGKFAQDGKRKQDTSMKTVNEQIIKTATSGNGY